MATFLLKTEPSTYSFADLTRDKSTAWTGVTNAQALIHIRAMKPGDEAFIYHTGDEKAIVGLAKVTTKPYADKSNPAVTPDGQPKLAVVDIVPLKSARSPLTLAAIKADKQFADFLLVKNSRLSVMPVAPALDKLIRQQCGL